jgi:hypothetical protein
LWARRTQVRAPAWTTGPGLHQFVYQAAAGWTTAKR